MFKSLRNKLVMSYRTMVFTKASMKKLLFIFYQQECEKTFGIVIGVSKKCNFGQVA